VGDEPRRATSAVEFKQPKKCGAFSSSPARKTGSAHIFGVLRWQVRQCLESDRVTSTPSFATLIPPRVLSWASLNQLCMAKEMATVNPVAWHIFARLANVDRKS